MEYCLFDGGEGERGVTMSIDEIIKALRCDSVIGGEACKLCAYGKNDSYCMAAEQDAAGALEHMERNMKIEQQRNEKISKELNKKNKLIATIKAERDELKASQPVRCGECKHINKTPKNEPYYPGAEKYRCVCLRFGTPTRIDSFCQLGERRGAE